MGGQKKVSPGARGEIMGFTLCQKPAVHDLMQNCDLPRPSKVFMGQDKAVMLSMNRVCNNIAGNDSGTCRLENGDDASDKMRLLRALQASQTRAREAEKKAAVLRKDRDRLSIALLEEAVQLFAYRQQVRLLELQVSNLQSLQLQQQPAMPGGPVGSPKEDDSPDEEKSSIGWAQALALSLGIGVTTAIACRYFL